MYWNDSQIISLNSRSCTNTNTNTNIFSQFVIQSDFSVKFTWGGGMYTVGLTIATEPPRQQKIRLKISDVDDDIDCNYYF